MVRVVFMNDDEYHVECFEQNEWKLKEVVNTRELALPADQYPLRKCELLSVVT